MSINTPLLDVHVLQQLRENATADENFLHDVCERFIANATDLLPFMKDAAKQSDIAHLIRLTQRLQSSAKSIGAKQLTEYCKQLIGRGERGERIPKLLLRQVEQSLVSTRVALQMQLLK